MKPNILIITESDDMHAEIVQQELLKLDISHERFNVDEISTKTSTWQPTGNVHSWIKKDYTTVWFRCRTPVPKVPYELTEAYDNLESDGFCQSLFYTLRNTRWINPLTSLACSRPKIGQLIEANNHGLKIPDTIVTNDIKQIENFFDRHNGEIVAKPLQAQVIFIEDESCVFGTRKISKDDLNDLSNGVPTMLQARIQTTTEVRTVIFGNKVEAFKITKRGASDDIKQLTDNELITETWKLPDSVEKHLLALTKHYKLEFAACDFLLKDNGELLFLELNPNGQWLWLQYDSGHNLLNPFIEFLCT